ncbi:histidine kinase 3-like [Eucalyptus grandis]|uniref:histidine kinase 3-like n=1 Tax=Eucalyptus grandis TaxID=71139 RepID=UPI00192EAEF6|nr:histidine kinase 3-like [Eucalyptus grandis]
MVLLEWEIWDKDSGLSAIFLDKLRDMKPRVSPRLFLLSNSISSSGMSGATTDATGPSVIMKPLRASMLVVSLQRIMGAGNRISCSNGESPSLSLRNLLCGRKILVVDDNKVNLRVAEAALRKYGADVVCTDSGEKAIALLRPLHDFDACFMDILMPEWMGGDNGYVHLMVL